MFDNSKLLDALEALKDTQFEFHNIKDYFYTLGLIFKVIFAILETYFLPLLITVAVIATIYFVLWVLPRLLWNMKKREYKANDFRFHFVYDNIQEDLSVSCTFEEDFLLIARKRYAYMKNCSILVVLFVEIAIMPFYFTKNYFSAFMIALLLFLVWILIALRVRVFCIEISPNDCEKKYYLLNDKDLYDYGRKILSFGQNIIDNNNTIKELHHEIVHMYKNKKDVSFDEELFNQKKEKFETLITKELEKQLV